MGKIDDKFVEILENVDEARFMMSREQVLKILTNYDPNEANYDQYASSRIAASLLESKKNLRKRHRALFGILDMSDPNLLHQYDFDYHKNHIAKSIITTEAHLREMEKTAQSIAREYSSKCVVLIQNYNDDWLDGELYGESTGEFGFVFYFENNQLIRQFHVTSQIPFLSYQHDCFYSYDG